MEVNFTGIAPDEMVFEFSTGDALLPGANRRPRAERPPIRRWLSR